MNPYPENFLNIIRNARQAAQHGDGQAARRWAEQAIEIVPDAEEPWLILAAFSSPRG